MGDTSEMMLDGTLCEGCGVYLGGGEFDIPLLCVGCAKERRRGGHEVVPLGRFWQDQGEKVKARALKAPCPTCGKYIKAAGLEDHARAVHQQQQPTDSGPAINT